MEDAARRPGVFQGFKNLRRCGRGVGRGSIVTMANSTKQSAKAAAADARRERDRLKKQRKRATPEGAAKNRVQAAAGMQRLRAVGREVEIPRVVDQTRRDGCKMDLVGFYETYFPHYTYLEPAAKHLDILRRMEKCIIYGTSKALAAPRGFGKDTLFAIALIWATAYGHRKWLVYVGAKMEDAVGKLENIKHEWETNELLLEDFPEIAAPIRALERSPQRAKGQRILVPPPPGAAEDDEGEAYFSFIKWGSEEVVYPTVEGSDGGGAIISAAGLDGAVRGKNRGELRPDMAVINDGETAQSARSEVQRETRTRIIEQDVSGLAGPGKTIAKFMLCTIICPGCVADTFTDKTKKPAWDGERIAALMEFPDREDLWEEYMRLRREGQMTDDPHGRIAHGFYKKNRKAMDAGSLVAWPARFNRNALEDGEAAELSALQHIYNQRCDNGEVFFYSEMQNDPLPENQNTIGLTPKLVASRCGGYTSGVIPAEAIRVTCGIDVGARELHSVVKAWMANGDSYVVDYSRVPVEAPSGDLRNPDGATRLALEYAVLSALRLVKSEHEDYGFKDSEGDARHVDMTLVDSGFLEKIVYTFCNESGPKYRPIKGYGTRQGQKRYAAPAQKQKTRRPMYQCYASKLANRQIIYHVNADYWKLFAQLRFLQDPETNGSCALFGMEPAKHRNYAQHICSEIYDPVEQKWVEESKHNHFLDSTAYADCAAGMLGIRIEALAAEPQRDASQAEEPAEATPQPSRKTGQRVRLPAPPVRSGGARTVVRLPKPVW